MKKSGFVLFTALLYMSVLTFIYLVNLNMYASQMKLNEEISLSYQAQILSRLAVEKVIADQEKTLERKIDSSIDEAIRESSSKDQTGENAASLAEIDSNPDTESSQLEQQQEESSMVTLERHTDSKELADGKWIMQSKQGSVDIILKDGVFNTNVRMVENGHLYAYTNVPYDQRTRN